MILEHLDKLGKLGYVENYLWEMKFLEKTTHKNTKPNEILSDVTNYYLTKVDIQKEQVVLTVKLPFIEKLPIVSFIHKLTDDNIWAIQTEIKDEEETLLFVIQSEVDENSSPIWKIELGDTQRPIVLIVTYKISETKLFQ